MAQKHEFAVFANKYEISIEKKSETNTHCVKTFNRKVVKVKGKEHQRTGNHMPATV